MEVASGTTTKPYHCRWRYIQRHWPVTSQQLAILIIFLLLWAIGASVLPEYALPSSAIMRMLLLFVGAQVCGIVVSFVGLPDMLGMMFFGILYTNVGWGHFEGLSRLEAALR